MRRNNINHDILMGVWYGYTMDSVAQYMKRMHSVKVGQPIAAPQSSEDRNLGYLRGPNELDLPITSLRAKINMARFCPTPFSSESGTVDDYEKLVTMVDNRHSGFLKMVGMYHEYVIEKHPELELEPFALD